MTNFSELPDEEVCILQALADFQMALSAVTFLCELDPDEPIDRITRRRYRCFEDTAVIAYCRPFTQSKGLQKLSFKKVGIRPTADQNKLHDQLWTRRNKVIAHTDIDLMRLSLVTYRPFEAHDVTLPRIDFDDSLMFFDVRYEMENWLHVLISAAAGIIFDRAQVRSPMKFIRDHSV